MNESEADKLAPVILDFFEFVMKHKPQTARKKTPPPKVQAAQAVKMPPSKLKLLTHEIAQDSYQIHCASRFSRSGILRRTSLCAVEADLCASSKFRNSHGDSNHGLGIPGLYQ
jgi:hypothetical protein